MGNVIKFNAHNKEYQLSVIDRDGEKWVTVQQVAEAIGVKNIHSLINDLEKAGELIENKHCCRVTLESSLGGPPRIILSYRGVIRVAMRSQGSRASEFRDWAEDVLFQVMVTGSYCEPEAIEKARSEGIQVSFEVIKLINTIRISLPELARLCYFRRQGLTQREAGAAFGLSRDKVQRLEKKLRPLGISFKSAQKHLSDREAVENVTQTIFGPLGKEISAR